MPFKRILNLVLCMALLFSLCISGGIVGAEVGTTIDTVNAPKLWDFDTVPVDTALTTTVVNNTYTPGAYLNGTYSGVEYQYVGEYTATVKAAAAADVRAILRYTVGKTDEF